MKLSVAVGVLLAQSSIEHAAALSIHPRMNTALSSTSLRQPAAPVTETEYNNDYNEDGFDVDYITSALLEPPSPLQLGQQPSVTYNNGWTAPNSDNSQFGQFDEPVQQINQRPNPLTQPKFVNRNDNKSSQAPNQQTQQPAHISNQQLARRTNYNKQKVITGRERRTNWESYAIPGIPARNTASNMGGVIGSPSGIGEWNYSSSYGAATSTYSTDTGLTSPVSSVQTGTYSFSSYSNGMALNQNRANSKNYDAVLTGAERRARFDSFHSFEPISPQVGLSSRVSAFDGASVDRSASVNSFAPRKGVDGKIQEGAVVGLGADRFASFNNDKPSIPARGTQRGRSVPGLNRNNQPNLVGGAVVDQSTNINGFASYQGEGRGAQGSALSEAMVVDGNASLNSFEPYDSVHKVQKSEQAVNGVASHTSAERSTASFNGFNPTVPSPDIVTGSQREHVVTSRPFSANGFKPFVPTPGTQASGREGPGSRVGGIARPNKFEPFMPNGDAQINRQGNAIASPSSPAINIGGSASPTKFEPFVPSREPQNTHQGNAVTSRPRSAGNLIETGRPNKFAPFVPTREAQKHTEEEDSASDQDLVSFLKNPRTAKKNNAKDVAASLSAMSSTPTFYNDFASPEFAEAPMRQRGTYGNQSYDQNFASSNGALQDMPLASEVPMDTPARQSLPPHLSLSPIPGKGLGVITNKPIKIGEFVGNYEGEIMPEDVKDRRYLKSLQHKLTEEDREWIQSRLDRGQTITGCYLYGVDLDGGNIYKHFGRNRGNGGDPQEEEHVSRIFVDAEDEYTSLWTRFINHASPPLDNLKPMSVPESYDGKPRVWFMAKRDIEAGEELCFDYGDDYWLEGDEVF
eukprot:CCRYP_013094-RA/>CCRYP_013094-RA protein AED:0.54 eAED:0.42 QI:0/-1/0/1/-1/1/1/0/857